MEYWNLGLNTSKSFSMTCGGSWSFLHLTAFPKAQGWQVISVLLTQMKGSLPPPLYSPSPLSLPHATRHSHKDDCLSVYLYLFYFIYIFISCIRMHVPHMWICTSESNFAKWVHCSSMWVLGLRLESSVSLARSFPTEPSQRPDGYHYEQYWWPIKCGMCNIVFVYLCNKPWECFLFLKKTRFYLFAFCLACSVLENAPEKCVHSFC